MSVSSSAGQDETRLPQDMVDKARASDIGVVAARYGFAGRAATSGEAVGPCPGCGGRDRFSLNLKKNIWRCRQGGGDPIGGDAISLVMHCEQVSFRRAVDLLVGDAEWKPVEKKPEPVDDNQFREKERRRAFQLWREAFAFPDHGAVATYLAGRGLDPYLARLSGAFCREHPDMPFWQPYQDGPALPGRKTTIRFRVIHHGPAMLWPIVKSGHFLGLHATWLDASGPKGKAEIFCPDTGEQLPAKKVRGSKKGGAIILRDAVKTSPEAAVGEGVESVLSWLVLQRKAGVAFDGSLYASVDLGNLAGRAARSLAHPTLKIPRRDGRQMSARYPGPTPHPDDDPDLLFAPHPGVERLALLGDSDSEPVATQAAMARAMARLERQWLACSIDWPPAPHDFNSLLMSRPT